MDRKSEAGTGLQPDAETLAIVRQTLRQMPKRTRRVFELHRYAALDYGTIAARLGISTAEVERHVAQALRLLACALFDSEER